ncbi:MAG: serine--tRNA ligase [Rickettsia sp.]|nr:serine--tRNA ligase [Rickettsia sp.]
MLSIKWIRNNKESFSKFLKKRNIPDFDLETLLTLDEEVRQITTLIQSFKQSKSKKSALLAKFRGVSNRDVINLKRDIDHIDEKLSELDNRSIVEEKLHKMLSEVPNLLDEDVPEGIGEDMNQVLKTYDASDKKFSFEIQTHDKILNDLQMIDFINTSKFSGSKFVTLKGDLAKFNRALINFMIDHNTNYGFEELYPPYIVRESALYNTGQLYKFHNDLYLLSEDKLGLIPTGEVPLVNMVADSILKLEELPKRFVAFTSCFRREAGSAGVENKGLIRNHQFGKVELVSITDELNSKEEHEFLLHVVENLLKKLEIPYRVVVLCGGDTGFTASKTFDIEIWLPASKIYKEISSISNCRDFQSRRANIRYKDANNKNVLAHSLNASSTAIGRTIIAIAENYQDLNHSISIPSVLIPYMDGQKKLMKKKE